MVHGVGFAELDRSHFHCMDVWQAGDAHHLGTGWLGRWLDLGGSDPLDAVAVGRRVPLLVRGGRRSGAVLPTGPFNLPEEPGLREHLAGWLPPDVDVDRTDLRASVVRSTADLLTVVDTVAPIVDKTSTEDSLAAQLATVAALDPRWADREGLRRRARGLRHPRTAGDHA